MTELISEADVLHVFLQTFTYVATFLDYLPILEFIKERHGDSGARYILNSYIIRCGTCKINTILDIRREWANGTFGGGGDVQSPHRIPGALEQLSDHFSIPHFNQQITRECNCSTDM